MLTSCQYSSMSPWWHSMRCSPSLPRTVQFMFLSILKALSRATVNRSLPRQVSTSQMTRFKFLFALFSRFQKHKKVRSPAASAEMTWQVEISTLSAHQMAPAGVVAHSSSWTPAAYELDESSPLSRVLTFLDRVPKLPGDEGQGDNVACILMGLTAGNAAGFRGGVTNTGIEDILVLPAVTVVSLLPGPAHRDGFTHVLGLRIVVPEAFRVFLAGCSGSGSRTSPDVAASPVPAVAAAASCQDGREGRRSEGKCVEWFQRISSVCAEWCYWPVLPPHRELRSLRMILHGGCLSSPGVGQPSS